MTEIPGLARINPPTTASADSMAGFNVSANDAASALVIGAVAAGFGLDLHAAFVFLRAFARASTCSRFFA
jgi:hypothetical protein